MEIKWEEEALGELDNLESHVARRIIKKVDSLLDKSVSKDIKRLKASNYFRLRVGDYRVFFVVDEKFIKILKS